MGLGELLQEKLTKTELIQEVSIHQKDDGTHYIKFLGKYNDRDKIRRAIKSLSNLIKENYEITITRKNKGFDPNKPKQYREIYLEFPKNFSGDKEKTEKEVAQFVANYINEVSKWTNAIYRLKKINKRYANRVIN